MASSKRCAAKWLLLAGTVLLVILHLDYWNWTKVDPRLFGFLPIGLAYHAFFAVACSILMFSFVRFAWPSHLEQAEHEEAPGRRDENAGH